MNADASSGVGVNGRFARTIPHLFALTIGVLAGGAVVALIGVILLVVGVRMRTRSQVPPSAGVVSYR